MRDNAFGKIIKVAVGLWTAFCVYGCVVGASNVGVFEQTAAMSDAERGGWLMAAWAMWGAIWFFPSLAALVLYLLLGRSERRGSD